MTLFAITPELSFGTASSHWLEARSFKAIPGAISARYIRDTTEQSYRQYIQSLNLFFAEIPLNKIHLGHIRSYQLARINGHDPFIRKRRPNKNVQAAPCPASPKKCNQELSLLRTILTTAGLWSLELASYHPLNEELDHTKKRAATKDERQRWLDVCLLKERWHVVYWYSVLGLETSMSTNEIRNLRVGEINLNQRILNISSRGAKNRYRIRTLPLQSPECLWAVEQLLARARDLGAISPQHFVFPFRIKRDEYDPTKPMTSSGIKKAWQEVRDASGLTWFRMYDLRHTCATHWAEDGVNPLTIRSMMGHCDDKMMERYTHISEGAKRKALEASLPKIGPQSVSPFYAGRDASRRKH
jgi:integrase